MNKDLKTRDQIIEAALHLFATKGFAQTGMDEIAKEVGITKPAVYYYFDSKDTLFKELLAGVEKMHNDLFESLAVRKLPLPDLIEAICAEAISHFCERPDYFRMINRIFFAPIDLPPYVEIERHHRMEHEFMSRLLEASLGEYRLRAGAKTEDFCDFVMNDIGGVLMKASVLEKTDTPKINAKLISEMVLYGAVEKA
jgi:AcrR family transcriptional regulator